MRILVEPCAHGMINAGDTAMLSVATARLRQLWPDARIGVITDVPARLALHCPGTLPVPAEGRRIWLEEPHVGARVHGMLSPSTARGLRAVEERVRRRWPGVASSTIRLRRRLRRLRNEDLTEFLDWLYSADLVVATGAGLLADPYVPRACSVLELLETAIRRGVPTAMLGQGIGPLTDGRMRAVARRVLPKVELIGLREEHYGRPELRALGVEDRRIVTTGDDAIELAFKRASHFGDRGGIGVGIRVARYSGATAEALAAVGSALRKAAARHGAELIPVPISAAVKERDATMIARVMGIDEATIPPLDGPAAVIDQVGRCRVVVSGSYHGAVFALAQGVQAIGLVGSPYYAHKFSGLEDRVWWRLHQRRFRSARRPAEPRRGDRRCLELLPVAETTAARGRRAADRTGSRGLPSLMRRRSRVTCALGLETADHLSVTSASADRRPDSGCSLSHSPTHRRSKRKGASGPVAPRGAHLYGAECTLRPA